MTDQFELLTRELEFRAASVDLKKREIVGRAVPYNQDATIGGYMIERFATAAVQDSADAKLFWRHGEPIGKVIAEENTDGGWDIVLRVSKTQQGDEALILAEDGVVTQLSVGFEPGGDRTVEERVNDLPIVTRTRVRVREVSLVPFGAYGDDASVIEVRERQPHPPTPNKEKKMDPEEQARQEALALQVRENTEAVEDLERRMATLPLVVNEEPVLDTRSAGEVVRAIVAGDADTITRVNEMMTLNRAYTGGTSADSPIKDAWVGDLTRIFDASSGALARIFSSDVLPATGLNLEYGQLKSNTVALADVPEGDDLAFGKVELETKTTPVYTDGGYSQLTRLQIERSTLPILNRTLEAMARAAGARSKARLRAAYDALYAARLAVSSNGGVVVLGATLGASTLANWTAALIDGAVKFEQQNLDIEHLVVSTSVFKKFDSLYDTAGRPLFSRKGDGSNSVGTLRLPGLEGDLEGVHVVCDTGATGDKAAYVNSQAIRHYQSSLVQLQDENIINLSKDFSVYRYTATAAEIPAGVVPVKLAAS